MILFGIFCYQIFIPGVVAIEVIVVERGLSKSNVSKKFRGQFLHRFHLETFLGRRNEAHDKGRDRGLDDIGLIWVMKFNSLFEHVN